MFDYRQTMNPGTVPGAGTPAAAQAMRDTLALELLKQRQPDQQKYESW